MGPQWSQWVSRTVEKLVRLAYSRSRLLLTQVKAEDGILDNSDPHGNVTFTPDAKKTFVQTVLLFFRVFMLPVTLESLLSVANHLVQA